MPSIPDHPITVKWLLKRYRTLAINIIPCNGMIMDGSKYQITLQRPLRHVTTDHLKPVVGEVRLSALRLCENEARTRIGMALPDLRLPDWPALVNMQWLPIDERVARAGTTLGRDGRRRRMAGSMALTLKNVEKFYRRLGLIIITPGEAHKYDFTVTETEEVFHAEKLREVRNVCEQLDNDGSVHEEDEPIEEAEEDVLED